MFELATTAIVNDGTVVAVYESGFPNGTPDMHTQGKQKAQECAVKEGITGTAISAENGSVSVGDGWDGKKFFKRPRKVFRIAHDNGKGVRFTEVESYEDGKDLARDISFRFTEGSFFIVDDATYEQIKNIPVKALELTGTPDIIIGGEK